MALNLDAIKVELEKIVTEVATVVADAEVWAPEIAKVAPLLEAIPGVAAVVPFLNEAPVVLAKVEAILKELEAFLAV